MRHTVQTLRLRPQAPWPLQCLDVREMILAWRRSQDTAQQLKKKDK